MFADIFKGLFDTDMTAVISAGDFMICVGSSLLLGLIIAAAYALHSRCTKSFLATLALLPAVVCVVIMMVNGNIGTGVAVAGAFSLVRFRSVPGTAEEIGVLFLAVGAGLIAGMGYIAYAFLFAVILSAVNLLYSKLTPLAKNRAPLYKTIRITIPEDLDYEGVFDGIFDVYAESAELTSVKTTNMGSLFRLTYDLKMKKPGLEKEMIDKLRQRNGNLEITLSKQETAAAEL